MPRVALDTGQLNREHPFLIAHLQSADDCAIVIQSGGRGRRPSRLCHLRFSSGVQSTKDTRSRAATRPHRICGLEKIALRDYKVTLRVKIYDLWWRQRDRFSSFSSDATDQCCYSWNGVEGY